MPMPLDGADGKMTHMSLPLTRTTHSLCACPGAEGLNLSSAPKADEARMNQNEGHGEKRGVSPTRLHQRFAHTHNPGKLING